MKNRLCYKKVAVLAFILLLIIFFQIENEDINNKDLQGKVIHREAKELKIIKDKYQEEIKEKVLLEEGKKVAGVCDKYVWAIGGNTSDELYKSEDYGDNWIIVNKFDKRIKAVHVDTINNIFISIGEDRWGYENKSQLFKSKNKENFYKVLDIEAGVALDWNIASDSEGYMFVSEYGNKKMDDNPRRKYRSRDFGENFEIVYEPEAMEGYHNHKIHIDRINKENIYQVIGDDVKFTLKSEDRGETWYKILEGYHPTSTIQVDTSIVDGLDNYPFSGFISVDENNEIIDKHNVKKPYSGSIYDIANYNNILIAGLTSYDYNNWDGSIFISEDLGNTWKVLSSWEKTEEIGVGFYEINIKDDYIFIWTVAPIKENNLNKLYVGTLRIKI